VIRVLRGVSEEHAAIIRQFQPYRGCEWTRTLRDLSNPDKHRELVSVNVDLTVSAVLTLTEVTINGDSQPDSDEGPEDMTMYLKGPALITLPDGGPVVETLRQLQTQVQAVLFIFTYEFPAG